MGGSERRECHTLVIKGERDTSLTRQDTALNTSLSTCTHLSGLSAERTHCHTAHVLRPIPKYMKVYAQWAWVCIAMHYLQGLL